MPHKRTLFKFIIVGVLCFVFGFIMGIVSHTTILNWSMNREYQARQEKFLKKPAPDITTQTLEGASWSSSEHYGKVILVNFWATWCAPCVQELPQLKELYNKYKGNTDFVMVGVSLDKERGVLEKFCKDRQIVWIQLYEENKDWNNSVAQAFSVRFIPSTWLIARDGEVVAFETNLDEIDAKIDELLNN